MKKLAAQILVLVVVGLASMVAGLGLAMAQGCSGDDCFCWGYQPACDGCDKWGGQRGGGYTATGIRCSESCYYVSGGGPCACRWRLCNGVVLPGCQCAAVHASEPCSYCTDICNSYYYAGMCPCDWDSGC